MALHNYIYVKHHTDIETERKIAREHDPRPTIVNKDGKVHTPQNNNNVLAHPHDHSNIKENWEDELKLDQWEDEESSDTDYMKKQLEKQRHKVGQTNSESSYLPCETDIQSTQSSSNYEPLITKQPILELSKEEIDLILCAKPMKLSKSQQSQQSIQQPSIEKSQFKDSKYVMIDGKKKKLKSRFSRSKKTSS